MNRVLVSVIFPGLCMALGDWPARAADFGPAEKVALKQSQIGEKQQNLAAVAQRGIQGQETSQAKLANVSATGELRYFVARLGGVDVNMVMDISKISRAKLYADIDGDGDFSGITALSSENKYTGSRAEVYGSYNFGEVRLAKAARPGDQAPAMKISGRYYENQASLTIAPAQFLEGRAKLADQMCLVGLVDGDADGKITATFAGDMGDLRGGSGFDLLAIDLNGDQKFEYPAEIYPLTPMVGVRGKCYGVKMAENGASIEFAPVVSGDFGQLAVGSRQLELTIMSENYCEHLQANADGTWKLPAGNYAVTAYRLADKGGWALDGGGQRLDQKVDIKKDGIEKISLGTPLTPKFEVSWQGDAARIGFQLLGAGGEQYAAGVTRNGTRDKPPAFKIVDREGKTIESGNFEYG